MLCIPMTVHRADRSTDIVVEALAAVPWGRVRPAICAALGLPEDALLYYGVGPAEDEWLLGTAPLLAGCELGTEPADSVPARSTMELAVLSGPDAGAAVPVGRRRILVGRGAGCTLRLTDPAVSLRHLDLAPNVSGLIVRDLGSTNGVFLDGCAVPASAVAQTGSIIRLGATVLQVRLCVTPSGGREFVPDGLGHLVRAQRPQPSAPPSLRIPPRPTAPTARAGRAIPLASALIGVAAGAGLALFTRNPLFLAFAVLGPVTMIGGAVADRLRGRRSHWRERAAHRHVLGEWQRQVDAAVAAFRREMWSAYPGPRELLRQARGPGYRLWQRSSEGLVVSTGATTVSILPEGGTFARDVATGLGGAVSEAGGAVPETGGAVPETAVGEPSTVDDDRSVIVADIPRILALRGSWGAVGIRGRAAARWLLAQLICSHSPADLAILLVGPGPDLAAARDLPHAVRDGTPDGRPLVVVIDGMATAPEPGHGGPPGEATTPARLDATRRSTPARQATLLYLADDEAALPGGTRLLGPGAELTGIGAEMFAQLCRAVMPLRDRISPTDLPETVDLVTVAGPLDSAEIARRWQRPSVGAVLGMGAGGPVGLDLDADGPHLLIAGTTGSGKSELLQSLITTLAIAAPPEATTMLLVDYKGGTAFGALAELPHVVAMLTDLDPALSTRALTSLRAELRRREGLAAAGRAAGRLIIVIDEFATLAVELPEFLGGLLDIAQRGRALGVHLILATQRPAGVVSPAMRANISARICLRVTDAGDSTDVIGGPEAAAISPRTPGRAIMATGSGRTTFQTALATSPTPPALRVRVRENATGRAVDPGSARDGRAAPGISAVQAVVAIARQLHGNSPSPHAPWAPPLPRKIDPGSDDPPHLFALADLPQEQRQMAISAPAAPVLVVGPPRSGRSTALRRLATAAAYRGEEVLVIDGAGDLADLAAWPQVSSYLRRTDGHLVIRLLTLLTTRESGRIRHLVIDRLDAVGAEIERLDYTAGALLAEAITAGSVRPAASGPVSLRHGRLGTAFATVVELHSPSRPGHGTADGAEIQIVHCPPCAPPPPETAAWSDPTVVRTLPDHVTRADLPPPEPHRISLGIGGDDAHPITVDLTGSGGAIVVTGPRRTGTSTTLATIAAQAADAGVDVWWLSTNGRPAPAGSVFDLRAGTERLRAALAKTEGPFLLVADDASADHPAAELLERFLAHYGPGQYLLIGERLDGLARARRGHLAAALGHRRGLLLSPDATDGPILDIRVPRRTGPVQPGRGLWVEGGSVCPVQVAMPAPDRVASRRTGRPGPDRARPDPASSRPVL